MGTSRLEAIVNDGQHKPSELHMVIWLSPAALPSCLTLITALLAPPVVHQLSG